MIIWCVGQSGSGKTTLAKKFQQPGVIFLDGDSVRNTINKDLGFSKEDRVENNLRVARLAKLLSDQGHSVVVSLITPYRELRIKIQKICNPTFIYLPSVAEKDRPYEQPNSGELDFSIKI